MKFPTCVLLALATSSALAADPLDRTAAQAEITRVHAEMVESTREARAKELEAKSITLGDKSMRWLEKTFGEAPADGRSLWISMHGGGGAPAQVNDQQWQNQIRLYQPAEGIYLAPRAPTDTWNLWHEAHIDDFFDRLITSMVALRGVNPDKVYLMGYSAGGDGVWQLAPRMADRFAAASMMAGHPNEAQLDGLRNLPFALFMGGEDAAYDRNKIAAERAKTLDELAAADPGGYTHLARIYPGLGHWMELKDAESVPWMAKHTRQPWPKKLVWLQDDRTHSRFYWLRLPADAKPKAGDRITAEIQGQTITLDGNLPKGLRLWLSDSLLDLDKPVHVRIGKAEPVKYEAHRSKELIRTALGERLDPAACPVAEIVLP
ncbi:MAG: dienelactone hydrolase family protein [Akkermansiaceae bacterium]|jgi:poly(3-hydroxybutyrate) depolymerase|nr:dienelactone hydrolase family protein [Akkermansiaceae bacterium]